MPWVQVKPGVTHGVGHRYAAGAVFEATADEFRAFGDKFLVVAGPEPEPVAAAAPAAAEAEVEVVAEAAPAAAGEVKAEPKPRRRK